MTCAVDTASNMLAFVRAWDDPGDPANDRAVPLHRSGSGNINATGTAGVYTGHLLTRWQPQFADAIEPGVQALVRKLAFERQWITLASCEGHRYDAPGLRPVPRHVGVLPRNDAERRLIERAFGHVSEYANACRLNDSCVSTICETRAIRDGDDVKHVIYLIFRKVGNADWGRYFADVDAACQRVLEAFDDRSAFIDFEEIRRVARQRFRLGEKSPHGPDHWQRVEQLALRLCLSTDADPEICRLFALLHDSCRETDGADPEHGARAAAAAVRLVPGTALGAERLQTLTKACADHSRGGRSSDPTIGTCWDADRLDLIRLGNTPVPALLSTPAARGSELAEYAALLLHETETVRPKAPAERCVYHTSNNPDTTMFHPRLYWHMDWRVSHRIDEQSPPPPGASIVSCVYASTWEAIPFFALAAAKRRIYIDLRANFAMAPALRSKLCGAKAGRVIVFPTQDLATLRKSECWIYSFDAREFTVQENGDYTSDHAVAPIARAYQADVIQLAKDRGYDILLVDDISAFRRTLCELGAKFDSEGFEDTDVYATCAPLDRLKAGLGVLRDLPTQDLADADRLTELMCDIGLTSDGRELYGPFERAVVHRGMGLFQNPRQLAELLIFLSRYPIRRFVEIGTGSGWTIAVIAEYLARFNPDVQCVSVDPVPGPRAGSEVYGTRTRLIHGTAHEVPAGEIDACFIDGDHSYEAVAADFALVGSRSRICAFHDINDIWCPDVARFWSEVRTGKVAHEFTWDPEEKRRFGVGVLVLDPAWQRR